MKKPLGAATLVAAALAAVLATAGCMTQNARTDSGASASASNKEMGKPIDETPLSRCRVPCSVQPGPGCC